MDGFKSITVLNIMFVRIPTCGTLVPSRHFNRDPFTGNSDLI